MSYSDLDFDYYLHSVIYFDFGFDFYLELEGLNF